MLAENERLPQFSSDVVQYLGRDGCSYSTSLNQKRLAVEIASRLDWLDDKPGFWPRYPCAAIGIEASLRLSSSVVRHLENTLKSLKLPQALPWPSSHWIDVMSALQATRDHTEVHSFPATQPRPIFVRSVESTGTVRESYHE
jgi:hypothetical protein